MALRVPTIALRFLGQYGVGRGTVESILWMSTAVNSLSVRENRCGHLRNPLPVDGRQLRTSFLVLSICYLIFGVPNRPGRTVPRE